MKTRTVDATEIACGVGAKLRATVKQEGGSASARPPASDGNVGTVSAGCLFESYHARVMGFWFKRGMDYATASDHLGEWALRLVLAERRGTLPTGDNPTGWVFQVARNVTLDIWRKSLRSVVKVCLDAVAESEAHQPDLENWVDVSIATERLHDVYTNVLTPRQRLAFDAMIAGGEGQTAYAERVGCAKSNATRLKRQTLDAILEAMPESGL